MSSQWEDKSKPHLNIVFVGHVDHGKSTTVGRLLLDTGHIDAHVVEKFEQEAQERGKPGFGFAYVMDGLKEERERGITIDVAHKEFFTPTQPTAHSQLDDAKSATSGSDATGENKKKLSRRPSSFPLTASQSSEALIAMTGGILNFAQRLAIIPGVGVVQERQAQKAGVMSTSDQARVEELLDQPIDIAQEAMLPINGFPFTAHRYTTMDQLYVLFEMVKVNVVFIITNSKRLEGMISKGQLMQQLKKTVKR